MSLDWSNERYIRLYTRETGDDFALSKDARFLWYEILRRVDRSGVLQLGRGGTRALAGMVRDEPEAVANALEELLADGRVQRGVVTERDDRETQCLLVPNFIEAQEATKSDAQRQRESRERRRALHFVTKCDEHSKEVVTKCDEHSGGSSLEAGSVSLLAVPSLAVPSRADDRQLSLTPSPMEQKTQTARTTTSANPKSRRTSRKAPSPKSPPLPFTVAELVAAFKRGAGTMFADGPVDRGIAMQLTAVVRQLDEHQLGLAEVEAAGRMVQSYPEPIGAKWLAKAGNLFDVVAKSKLPRRVNGEPGRKTDTVPWLKPIVPGD